MKHKIILLLAQGFGSGLVPRAPGTAGSVLGLGWFAALLATRNLGVFFLGCVAGMLVSVWVCGEAERLLNEKDPGCIVLDEIIALPWCFVGVLLMWSGSLPTVPEFFVRSWHLVVGGFVAFRIFDILKPWPVEQSQRLRGGWGVTMDDVLAAVYTNAVTLGLYFLIW